MKTYSFIIPHHNTPDLLQRLINTIPQRNDIEIIVVDDSSDEDKKANTSRHDVKIIYIDKEHTKGAGHARNVGMDVATGKWLLFADADDMYKPNFIDVLDEYKNDDFEILFFNVDSVDSITLMPGSVERAKTINTAFNTYKGDQISKDILLFDCSWTPWRKMLLAEYVRHFNLRYEEVPISNDILFTFVTSYFASKWKLTSKVLYTVTYSRESMSYSMKSKEKHVSLLITKKRVAKFYRYIGHWEWNWKSPSRGFLATTCFKYIITELLRNFKVGMKVLLYYLSNCISIVQKSNYYVDVINLIKTQSQQETIH